MAAALFFFALSGAFSQEADTEDVQPFFVRPHASVGLGTVFGASESGIVQFYGLRALLAAGPTQRFGLELSWADQDFGAAGSSLRTGIVLEQVLFSNFHMAIGTIGYVDLGSSGTAHPFAVTSTLGYESSIGVVHWMVGFQSDFVFYQKPMNSNGLILGVWL